MGEGEGRGCVSVPSLCTLLLPSYKEKGWGEEADLMAHHRVSKKDVKIVAVLTLVAKAKLGQWELRLCPVSTPGTQLPHLNSLPLCRLCSNRS